MPKAFLAVNIRSYLECERPYKAGLSRVDPGATFFSTYTITKIFCKSHFITTQNKYSIMRLAGANYRTGKQQ